MMMSGPLLAFADVYSAVFAVRQRFIGFADRYAET